MNQPMLPLPLPAKRLFRVYCDESGQTGCRYMVYGGVVIKPDSMALVSGAITAIRRKHNIFGEFKWGKVSPTKLPAYSELVNVVSDMRDHIHFKAMILDTSKIDKGMLRSGDPEDHFYMFYWHLLYHKFHYYLDRSGDALLITLDERSSSYPLSRLRDILNAKYWKHRRLVDPVRSVEPCCSKRSDMLQLADVLIGAVGYHSNDHDKNPKASEARVELARSVCRIAGVGRLNQETRYAQMHVEIWPFKLRQK